LFGFNIAGNLQKNSQVYLQYIALETG